MGKLSEFNIVETLKDKTKLKELLNALTECFFLLVIFCLTYRIQVGLTTFYIEPDYTFWRRLYKLTMLAAGFKAAINCKNKTLWLSIPIAAVFYLAFPREHYLWEPFYAPLIVGCVGVKVRKILYAVFIPATVVIVNMMVAALSGGIESMATIDRNIRSYWGHISPTDFGTAILMMVGFFWILFKKLPDEFFIIPAGFSLFISFYITRSSTSGYLTVLLMLMFLCRIFGRRVVEKRGKFKWAQKLTDIAMLLVFPVFGMLTLAMVYAYYKEYPFAGTLNIIFHQRLLPAANMLAEHGLKPFGTYFEMHGFGGTTIGSDETYTFIDSAYPQILIRYGVVTYLVANVLWVYTIWKALKTGNRRVAYVMALLAVDFVMEHHWYELSYNAFLLMPFADFTWNVEGKSSAIENQRRGFKDRWKERKYTISFVVMCLIQILVIFILLPTAFSWLRTIFNGFGIYGGGRRGAIEFAGLTFILMTAVAFIWSLSGFSTDLASYKRLRKIHVIPLMCAFFISIGSFLAGNTLINHVEKKNIERIESERGLLEYISSKASGKIYADKLPEVYIRNIKGISSSYFCGEDYARYDNATIITEAAWDSQCLIERGFLYLQISEEDAIYTNDDSVIKTLEENGYKLKGYNSYEYKVDLMALAEINDVEILDNGGIQLEGKEHQLIHGPYITLNYGGYTAKFSMRLSEGDFSQDDKICTIRIAAYSGRQEKCAVDLYRRDFDDEGKLDYEVAFEGYGQNNEFLVLTEDGVEMEIDSITYRRTPGIDTHRKTDNEGRLIRVEYHNYDGTPYETSDGYCGCEYSYDRDGNVIVQRYLGRDFKPVIINEGYAEIHMEYNLKREVIRESYYGVNGEAIELYGECHSIKKEYDFNGNVIIERCYDTDEKPILKNDAYFELSKVFDENNRLIRMEYLGTDENLILQNEGYAMYEIEYDADGNIIEERYYGIQQEPVLYSGMYHKYKMEYNDKKQCIGVMFFGTDGEPILQGGNYAGYEREFDEAGNVTKLTYLGVNGKPVVTDWGYATCRSTYNSKKQVIHEEYFGTDNAPIVISEKYAMVDFVYAENGKLTKRICKDLEGNVVEEQIVE